MKEMKYQSERIIDVLDTGKCCGYTYYILNLGTHPTAYIKIPENHKYYGKVYSEVELPVHYGLTYSRNHLYVSENKQVKGWFLGWDYAHCDDYAGYEDMMPVHIRTNGKKWTTKEIQEEVIEACKVLERVKYEI